jgi:L-arabonate dehydrase
MFTKPTRRSQAWFGRQDKMGFYYRSFLKNSGVPQDQFDGRPVIGICNTWSELNPCNAHFRTIAEHVRLGVLDAGGFPLEFPVSSLGEVTMRPTAMLFRNLAAMDVEEGIRAHPLDGVVLLMGCDKTTPALLMGAASADLPTIGVSGGPQLRGMYQGRAIGSGTNIISMSEQLRAGEITLDEFHEAESAMNRSSGHCMTMGTASTMASMVEALGVGLPGNAAIPAVDARRNNLARMAGRRIVAMVNEDLVLSKILVRSAFENAIRTLAAIGGSTNAVVHLLAIAGRVGIDLTLEDFDRLGRDVHCLVDLMPSGRFLMEDFYYAGGLPVVLRALGERGMLHKDAPTVNGVSIWDNVKEAPCWNNDVITPFEAPFKPDAGIAILRGNLAPDGAVIKPSAASPELMNHTGRAVVFESIEDLHHRIDDDTLDIDADCIMVLKYCGPKGYPGMAEVGNMPLPRAAAPWSPGHYPDLRRAHVRHRVWHGGAARGARGRGGWSAGAGAERRPDHARCRGAAPASSCRRRHAQRATGRLDAAGRSRRARLCQALYRPCAAGRPRGGLRFPGRQIRCTGAARQSLIAN